MNLFFPAGLDIKVPDELLWVGFCIALFGVGSALLCAAGLACLLHELRGALQAGTSTPTTAASEFMGFGVAKERCQKRAPGREEFKLEIAPRTVPVAAHR